MKLERRNWDTSEIIKPLEEHAVFIKSLLDIDDVPPKEKKDHIQLDDFNKRIVNAIIEEGIKGNLDKAQKILEQKLKVEEASGGKNRLPEKVVSEIIPTIKEYFEENTEKIKQDLSTPEKKQPLAEKLQNIDSTTKAPDIQNSAHLIHEEIKNVQKSRNLKPTERVSFSHQIIPQEIEKNLPKSEIPTGKTSEGVISVVTDKNGEIKLHTNEDTRDVKKVFNDQQNTPEKEVSDIIKPSMEKNTPNNSPESNKFLVLEKEAEKIKLYYKNELKREFKNDPNDPVVKAFDENPYLWMQAEIGNGIARLKKATQKAKTGTEKQTLLNKIISLENKIPPINYVLKREALREIKDGDTLFITENGNTVKYKIVSIDQEKVRFDKEGYPLTMFLSRTAMENFLLNPSVSFKKEKIRPEQKGTEKNNKKNSEKTKTTPPIDKTPDAQTENIDTSNEKPVAVTEDTSEHTMESGGTEDEKTPNTEKQSKEDILREAREKIQEIEKKYAQKREETIDQFFKKK